MKKGHVANSVVMIKPRSFHANPETLASNSFQKATSERSEDVLKKAQTEFSEFQNRLTGHGINFLKFDEDTNKNTPDALFPNNWFCQLPNSQVFVFPMQAKNRRDEYRSDIISSLQSSDVTDLRYLEKENHFLEGTGSLILDHDNRVGFACLSPRTSQKALDIFSEKSGYQIISFDSVDEDSHPIYHTNVMMALSPKHMVVNLSSIKCEFQKKRVTSQALLSSKKIIDISYQQMNNFAGNMLFLKNSADEPFWVCSTRAYMALSKDQRLQLEAEASFIHSPLDTIENHGGGGARCLLAEIF